MDRLAPLYVDRVWAAWLAGVIDGKGVITVLRYARGSSISPRYGLGLAVTNCSADLLRRVREVTGTGQIQGMTGSPEGRRSLEWRQRGRAVGPVLLAVLPFLIRQRTQALVGMAMLSTWSGSGSHRTPVGLAYQGRLYQAMRTLNSKDDADHTVVDLHQLLSPGA